MCALLVRSRKLLNGKVAFITGASESVGSHLALSLAQHGCRLVLAGDLAKLATVKEKVKLFTGVDGDSLFGVEAVDLDVIAGEESIKATVQKAWNVFGRIDVLLNCATYAGTPKSSLEISEKEWLDVFNVNLNSAWFVTKSIARLMRDSGIQGSIVFVTSILGTERAIPPGVTAYATSMAAVNYLTKTLALDLGKYGIRVNAIARGISDTDCIYHVLSADKKQKSLKEALPLGRWPDVSKDFSSVVVHLASDASLFLTGTIIIIDGGQSIVRGRLRSFI